MLGYPLVIKPDAQGSSLGVAVVERPESLVQAVDAAAAYDGLVLAEPQVFGREFTVALLGERALPIIEIITPEPVFSYDGKYSSSLTEHRFDFELSSRTRLDVLRASLEATRALGTRGLVRVDLLTGHDERVWVLEVNTIPGLTPRSLAPLAAQRAGMSMSALCDELVRQCLATTGVV
jgi:D-alanine-D-alanine ligase